jgi:hypothetical protein
MVDSNINDASEGCFDTSRGTTTAGEIVDNQFIEYG